MSSKYNDWYKEQPNEKIWWLDQHGEAIGEFIFSFDKKERFNLFRDYPWKLTPEQKKIFDEEQPFWADFLKIGQKMRRMMLKNKDRIYFMEAEIK